MTQTAPQRARYIMIGGFLGAGKTTAILQFAQHLERQGLRIGLITNDQGTGLVDTAMARARAFPVAEIAGGCFCCRFNSLVEASARLQAAERPDVFLAEPVGSCTDLVATVNLPLRQMYGAQYQVAPLSVLVDPIRAQRVLGLVQGKQFAPKVTYIYRKQLEEANLVVINKADLLEPSQLDLLQAALRRQFPQAELLVISARHGTGLTAWFERVLAGEINPSGIMDVDYLTYGVGEAMLGWLNATVTVCPRQPLDGNAFLLGFASRLRDQLLDQGIEVAHLKMTLSPQGVAMDIGVVNLVRSDGQPELSFQLADPLASGELTVNLRAEAEPGVLNAALAAVTNHPDWQGLLSIVDQQSFKPGQPNPTHRVDPAGAPRPPVLPA